MALALGLVSARSLAAQTERWLDALATPPHSAGTCVAAPNTAPGIAARRRLVMVSVVPGRRREMSVSLDAAGRPRSYNEMSFGQIARMESSGETVFATIDLQGHAGGMRTHTTTTLTDSVPAHGDTAAVRRWLREKRHAVSNSTTEPLDKSTQSTVVALAKWLANRCK